MFEDAISLLSIFASMNSWLTPTVLFVLLNLMIGTIAVTSGFTSHKPNNNHHTQSIFHHHHHHIHHPQPPPLQPTLTRSPSVLQRLKSTINFSSFYSQQQQSPPTTFFQPQPQQPDPEPKPETEPEPEVEPNITSNVVVDDDEGPTLDEIYSRIKQGNTNPHYGRQNSDTKPSNGEIPVKLPQKMKKSASDKSAFNHFELQELQNVGPAVILEDITMDDVEDGDDVEEIENGVMKLENKEEREDEGVDAKADDFINRFKKQLRLQRKESMLREYKQMIHSRTTDVQ